jgi:hypothetical protein
MNFSEVCSKEELVQAVTKDNLSVLLLHASWNKKDKIKSVQLQITNYLKATKQDLHQLSINGLVMEVDVNDDTMDFCVGDALDDDNAVMDDVVNTNKLKIKCPNELPALYILHRNSSGMIKIANVPIRASQIFSWSDIAAMEAMEKAMAAFTINPSVRDDTIKDVAHKRNFDASVHLNKKQQIRLFVAGDKSQVGKSSVCMGILGTLLELNYPPSSLAYIKPATQCEETQLVIEYCRKHGIQASPVGPIVYYRGFTRAFLNGETESPDVLMQKVTEAVDKIAQDKAVVVIDGVGYPAVGSITNTDNARVAQASGYPNTNVDKARIPPGVLIVGKRGVGDAVDSYNLNSTYFRSRNIPILGAVFNRLPVDGYYSLENCKEAVTSYFEQNQILTGGERVFGFIPEVEGIANSRSEGNISNDETNMNNLEPSIEQAETFVTAFGQYVNVPSILQRAAYLRDVTGRMEDGAVEHQNKRARTDKLKNNDTLNLNNTSERIRLTREQIEQSAKVSGAAGG